MSNQRKGNKLKKIDKKVANKAVTEIPELNWDEEKKKLQINSNSASPEEYVTQMVNVHNLAMEFSRRSMFDEQSVEGVERNINRVTKLMRTFTAQAECLNRYRTGGKQTIQVKHVNVNEGGQAIVGNVQGGGANG